MFCDTLHYISELLYCPVDGDSTWRIQDLEKFFFKLHEVVLKKPESITYSNKAGFVGSERVSNNFSRRIKGNEIETMQTAREKKK